MEGYQPQYGTGLIPESFPMLLEVAEFWCIILGKISARSFPN
jgi:hypothetical protein